MTRLSATLFGLLTVALLPSLVNNRLIYPLVLVSSVLIAIQALRRSKWTVNTNPLALILLTTIILVLVGHSFTIGSKNSEVALRTMAFLTVGSISLIVIPRVSSQQTLLNTVTVFAAGLTFVELLGLTFTSGYSTPMPIIDVRMRALGFVITGNPNSYGIICAIAGIAYLSNLGHRDWMRHIAGCLVLFGILFSQSRTAWLAVTAGGSIAIVYQLYGRRVMSSIVLIGGLLCIGGFVTVFLLRINLPVSLTGRLILWEAAIDAIMARPIFGYGLKEAGEAIAPYISAPKHVGQSTHNSYLRIFVTGGVIAGGAYLALHYIALRTAFQQAIQHTSSTIAPFALTVGVILLQGFEAMMLFGLTIESVLLAVSVGIALNNSIYTISPQCSIVLKLLCDTNEIFSISWKKSRVRVYTSKIGLMWKESKCHRFIRTTKKVIGPLSS